MNPTLPIAGALLRTYETIFQHPVSHNLAWRDVRILLGQLGEITMEPNGNLKATRNGQTLMLHPPRTKEIANIEELMEIRHFLQRSEQTLPDAAETESHWLVVINHHEARIFQSVMHGTTPQQILPHQPEDHFRQGHDSRDYMSGKEKPAPNSFFEPVTRALKNAGHILLFGSGTGASSEMDQFAAWLKEHHPLLAQRIVGKVVIDERHLTEPQLLAKAREFYANPPLPRK